jgi:hypothetical protein
MDFKETFLGLNFNWGKEKNDPSPLSQCLNCSSPLELDQYYCYTCGQKNKTSKVSFWSLMSELLSNIFNLDHSVWKSLFGVFKPGYLTKEFIKGRRKSYLNPLRLFFFAMVVHLALISNLINTDFADDMASRDAKALVIGELKEQFTAIQDTNAYFSSTDFDSLTNLLNSAEYISDTLYTSMRITDQMNFGERPIAKKDLYELSVKEVLDKYEIEGYWKRLLMGQFIKANKDIKGAIRFAFGNLLWAIIATIIILSFVMKVIYIRKNKYYVEHVLMLFNLHSFAFIVLSIPLALIQISGQDDSPNYYGILMLVSLIYGFWSFKAYYEQGWFKTLLKTAFLGFSYVMIMAMCLTLVLLISALLF